MKNNWKEATLGEIGRVVTGKTPSINNPEQWGAFLDFVTPSDIKIDSKYLQVVNRKLSCIGLNIFKRMVVPKNSIIVTCIGSDMGKVVMNKKDCVTNQQINSIIVNNNFNEDFIYYLLKNSYKILRANAEGGGSTMPIINKSTFENLSFLLPSIEEQKQIVAILSSLDDKIELLRNENETLEKIAQTIFKEWFVNFRINGEKLKLKNEIPERWKIGFMKDLGVQVTERVRNDKDRKVLSAINTGNLIFSEDYFSKQVYSESISNYIKCEIGDFSYNPARINIGSIGRNNLGVPGAVSPVYVVFRPHEIYGRWLEFVIKTNAFKLHVDKFANGSVRQALNYDGFSRFRLIIPEEKIIKAFNKIIFIIDKKVNFNNSQIQTISHLRDTLLPKLISGEINIDNQ